jgi:GNAT superfamily N-acetyltransferase
MTNRPDRAAARATAEHQFFNDARIVPDFDAKPRERGSLKDVPAEPFMSHFTVKLSRFGGAVYDGTKLIASIGRLNELVVDKDYRGQHIGTNLVVAWRQKFPDEVVTDTPIRSAAGDAVYKRAYAILKPA